LVLARGEHGLVRTAAGPEPVAVRGEVRFEQRGEHLEQRLLDEPIHYRRHPELAGAAAGLRDLHASHRRGTIRPSQELRFDPRPVFAQHVLGGLNVEAVHAGCAFVRSYFLPREVQVLARDHPLDQSLPWPGGVSTGRCRACHTFSPSPGVPAGIGGDGGTRSPRVPFCGATPVHSLRTPPSRFGSALRP